MIDGQDMRQDLGDGRSGVRWTEPCFTVSALPRGCRYRKTHDRSGVSLVRAMGAHMKLTDLNPRHMGDTDLGRWPWADDPPRLYHEIAFLCPRCRRHEISVAFWGGPQRDAVQVGDAEYGPVIKRLWHREGTQGFLDLTLTPSINRQDHGDKCGGWHGYITDGNIS